ncbi:MAG: transposase [Burkholderiaceae bacterium]|nr:transposase [Burkholderiaceae bacterium]
MSESRAHRIELIPNNKQRTYFARACGCARKAYNWALDEWQRLYALYKKDPENNSRPNEMLLRRRFNAIKRIEFPYMLEVTKCAPQQAIRNLGKAYVNHWRDPKRFAFPTYKKKYCNDSFYVSNDQFEVKGLHIRIPKLGWVRMRESLRFDPAKIMSATITREADRWFVSLSCELPVISHKRPAENQGVVGVDLGVRELAVCSNGYRIPGPKAYVEHLKKLKRLQRSLSRREKGSKRYQKRRVEIAKLHHRIRNLRLESLHQLTSYLTGHFHTIGIENLNVSGMLKNHRLAMRIADMGFYEFRRQLTYKAQARGCEVVIINRYYPSSRLCRHCGQKNEALTLSDRSWTCPHCGAFIGDRDFNAALNIRDVAASYAGADPTKNSSSGRVQAMACESEDFRVNPYSMNREENAISVIR